MWSEWNGKYRDTVRDFWRGTDQTLAEFAYRVTGSSDLYQGTARSPSASINFIAAHDGFTFSRRLIDLRLRHPVFCRRRWFQGRAIHGSHVSDIGWFTPGGTEMSEEDWQAGFAKSLGLFLNGDAIPTKNERGERVVDDSFYLMFNAHHEALEFKLPEDKWGSAGPRC